MAHKSTYKDAQGACIIITPALALATFYYLTTYLPPPPPTLSVDSTYTTAIPEYYSPVNFWNIIVNCNLSDNSLSSNEFWN